MNMRTLLALDGWPLTGCYKPDGLQAPLPWSLLPEALHSSRGPLDALAPEAPGCTAIAGSGGRHQQVIAVHLVRWHPAFRVPAYLP